MNTKRVIHGILGLLSVALILLGIKGRADGLMRFVEEFSLTVGTTLLVALSVAKIFEHFSLEELKEQFAYWNKKAAQASLSGILGAEIPEEIADNLIKIAKPTNISRTDYDELYRFTDQSGRSVCVLTISYTVKNVTEERISYVCRHEFHKGFFCDYARSLEFRQFKVYKPDDGSTLLSMDKRERTDAGQTIFFEKEFKIAPRQSLRFVSSVAFEVSDHFSFFDSFFQPMKGVKIRLEHDFDSAVLGFSNATFWKERFVQEYSDGSSLSLSYSGVVFPGQGIGIWMHRNRSKGG